ncbi:MAG: hypothetical protein ACREOK_12235, partial [Gemmatimonadaceae bacterium]
MKALRQLTLLALFLFPGALSGQKRALTQADWDIWKSISGATLTNDGKWAVYSLAPQVGDGELVIRSTSASTEYRIPRGYLGRPNNTPGGLRPRGGNPEEEPSGPSVAPAQVTADSRFAIALVYPDQEEFERTSRQRGASRRGSSAANRSDLAIVRLADGSVTRIERVRSFRLPRSGGGWMAYAVTDSTPNDSSRTGAARGAASGETNRAAGPRRRYGNPIVLRNLTTGAEERLADVLDYAFDDSATVFMYSVVSRDSTTDGVFVRNLSSGAKSTLLSGRGDYSQIAVDRSGSQFAFLSNRDEFGQDDAQFTLYVASQRDMTARPVVTSAQVGGDMRVAETANVGFTRAGTGVTFGVAGPRIDTLPSDSLRDKAVFDLWHYKDLS